jgi:hypothetical protein
VLKWFSLFLFFLLETCFVGLWVLCFVPRVYCGVVWLMSVAGRDYRDSQRANKGSFTTKGSSAWSNYSGPIITSTTLITLLDGHPDPLCSCSLLNIKVLNSSIHPIPNIRYLALHHGRSAVHPSLVPSPLLYTSSYLNLTFSKPQVVCALNSSEQDPNRGHCFYPSGIFPGIPGFKRGSRDESQSVLIQKSDKTYLEILYKVAYWDLFPSNNNILIIIRFD